MVSKPRKDIGEPGARIDIIELVDLDQRIDGCSMATDSVASSERTGASLIAKDARAKVQGLQTGSSHLAPSRAVSEIEPLIASLTASLLRGTD